MTSRFTKYSIRYSKDEFLNLLHRNSLDERSETSTVWIFVWVPFYHFLSHHHWTLPFSRYHIFFIGTLRGISRYFCAIGHDEIPRVWRERIHAFWSIKFLQGCCRSGVMLRLRYATMEGCVLDPFLPFLPLFHFVLISHTLSSCPVKNPPLTILLNVFAWWKPSRSQKLSH